MNKSDMEQAIYNLRLRMARVERAVSTLESRGKGAETPTSRITEAEVCPELYPRADLFPETRIEMSAPIGPAETDVRQPATGSIPPTIRRAPAIPAAITAQTAASSQAGSIEDHTDSVQEASPRMAWLANLPSAGVKPSPSPRQSLEMLIGMNWMAWAGALLVVLAVGFFVQVAYVQGWFGLLSVQWRCSLAAAFGAVLVGAGEYALRRINRAAAASLYGAGLGVLYLTAFATTKWFFLLSEVGAFWLLLGVALLGFAITVRSRLITTGVLATLGGYLTPILLNDAKTVAIALPLYITMLLTLALALSAWRERPFRALRYVALCCHVIIGALWMQDAGAGHWLMALIFMAIWWCLVNAESILAALRGQSAIGNPIASLFITAWVAFIGHQLIVDVQPADRDYLGLFAVCLAALAALPAALVGPGIKMLEHRPKRAVEKLGVALWAQAGVLLATAIGFQFDGFGQTIGWLALGYACVEVGRKLPSRGVDWFGLCVGALALARVATVDGTLKVLHTVFWQYGEISLTYWGLLAAGAVLTVYLSAIRLQCLGSPPRVKLPIFLMGLGTFGWLAICGTQADGTTISWGWLAAAAVLLASHRIGRRHRCFFFGRTVLGLTAIKWLALDGGLQPILHARPGVVVVPVVNHAFALGLIIAAGIATVTWLRYRREQTGDGKPGRWPVTLNIGVLFTLVALSYQLYYALEYAHADGWISIWPRDLLLGLSMTALWLIAGAAIIAAAWRTRVAALHTLGWSVLIVCGIAWLSFETVTWRKDHPPLATTPLANLQAGVGMLLLALTAFVTWREQRSALSEFNATMDAMVRRVAGWSLAALAGLWLGSLEIDRYFSMPSTNPADTAMARQTAFSIYWGVYALGLLAIGFAKQSAAARYAGLALLTITLGKVLIVDMAKVQYVYRVLSFLAVGLLLMGTSVAYAKLAKRLAGEGSADGSVASSGPTVDE